MKVLFLIICLGLVGCSKKYTNVEEVDNSGTIQKDFIVRDANYKIRPIWAVNATEWAKTKELDTEKFYYYSHETSPKADREIACAIAKANARADVAGQITTIVEKNLMSSSEGTTGTSEELRSLTEYVENTLAEKIKARVNGARLLKTYWEKRQYKKEMGASKDMTGFTCSALFQVEKKQIQEAITFSKKLVMAKASTPKLKQNVRSILDKMQKDLNNGSL